MRKSEGDRMNWQDRKNNEREIYKRNWTNWEWTNNTDCTFRVAHNTTLPTWVFEGGEFHGTPQQYQSMEQVVDFLEQHLDFATINQRYKLNNLHMFTTYIFFTCHLVWICVFIFYNLDTLDLNNTCR